MSKIIHKHVLLCFLLISFLISTQAVAQTVTVKMKINTSTCQDTLQPYHFVQLRGSSVLGTTPSITWDAASGIMFTNIGGDYWETSFQANPGDVIRFKIWTGFSSTVGTAHWGGWDGDQNAAGGLAGNDRALEVGTKDTTLPLQYYNWEDTKKDQYWRPFQSKQDTIAVYFRVNMGGIADFDPATQLVDARGGLPLGTNDWPTIITLARETNSVNSGSFWSGVAYVAKANVTAGAQQQYKFVVQPAKWENMADNRSFVFSANLISSGDTTIHWNYFNNMAPSGPPVNANILFRLKLDALEKAGLFNEALGDKVAVTGAKGWPPGTFVFDTEPAMLKLTYNSDLEEWNLLEPFSKYSGEKLEYKYYISWDTTRVDPASPNYIPGLALSNGWEEPGVTGGGNRTYTYTKDTEQLLVGDFNYDQQFFNSIPPKGVIETPISVTFKLNMAPAADVSTNPTRPLFRPGVDSVFVQFDGCMVAITQGLTMYGTDNRVELVDIDGDGVYTGTMDLVAPTFYQLCYRITYSHAPDASETNGGGTLFGRRYYQYIHPALVSQDGTVTWPASFELPQMDWKTSDLTVEDPPDLDTPTGVEENINLLKVYTLHQNYPNPFNPTTKISYSLPQISRVRLEVFNIVGQKVTTLFDGEQMKGTHSISWNAKNQNGTDLASGTYFLRMQAGSFVQIKKMMLLR